MKNNILVFVLFLSFSTAMTSQNLSLYSSYTYSIIPRFNDDKGSEYFSEENYVSSTGGNWFNVGISYQLNSKWWNNRLSFFYHRIESYSTYSAYQRIVPSKKPENLNFTVVKQNAGLRIDRTAFKYELIGKIPRATWIRPHLSASLSRVFFSSEKQVLFDQERWRSKPEFRVRHEGDIVKYATSLGIGCEFQLSPVFSIHVDYEHFVTPINNGTSKYLIRKYYPQVFSVGVRLYGGSVD